MPNKRFLLNKTQIVQIFLIILLISSSFITPLIKKSYNENWKSKVAKIKNDIESEIANEFIRCTNSLNAAFNQISFAQNRIHLQKIKNLSDANITAGVYNIDHNLIEWKSDFIQTDIKSLLQKFKQRETFIVNTPLINFLAEYRFINKHLVLLAIPLDKKYRLNPKYYDGINLFKNTEDKFWIDLELTSEANLEIADGRKSNFIIYNNLRKPIGKIIYSTPTRDSLIANLLSSASLFQSIVLIAIVVLWGYRLKKYFRKFKSKILSSIAFSAFLILFRFLLRLIDFPSVYFSTSLTDPSSFSSTFAFGLVKSPMDLMMTLILVTIILSSFTSVIINQRTIEYKTKSDFIAFKIFRYLITIIFLIIILLLWRALGASIKSFIFDSSLRYFKDYEFVPEITTLIMELNLLLVSFTILWAAIIVLFYFNLVLSKNMTLKNKKAFLVFFVVIQLSGFVFDKLQHEAQGNDLIRIVFITAVMFFSFHFLQQKRIQLLTIIYAFIVSSFISISLLIFHNANLENKSLKTISNEITRSNESLLNYSIMKCLSNAAENKEIKLLLKNSDSDFDQAAFALWSNSDFEKESVISNLNIISNNKELLGSFAFEYKENFFWDWSKPDEDLKGQRIITINSNEGTNTIRGIIPIKDRNVILGYVEVSAIIDLNSIGIEDVPPIFSSSKLFTNSPIAIDQLRIFDFQNGELKNYYTDIILPNHAIKSILKSDITNSNEAWKNILIGNKRNTFYVQKNISNGIARVLAIGKDEKNLAHYLFDFFKIFFIHSIFLILFALAFYFIFTKNQKKFRYSFRFQLLLAFTVISMLPLIFLAFYFRTVTNEKNLNSVYYKLAKRADSVENYFQKKYDDDLEQLFFSAAENLDVNFSVFNNQDLIYSTKIQYYKAGLIPKLINPNIYKSLVLGDQKEFVIEEKIDKFTYHSLYHKTKLNGKIIIIKISDLFNRIQLPMTGSEIDVFFFGIYSFTVLMLLFMSVFLANQISYPIRKLTQSMNAVGAGDLNVEVNFKGKGEIKDLITGFNKMVKKFRKNQSELAELERETAWKEMAKQVAHEIKNPLTPMKLSMQQLIAAKNDNSPKFDEYFAKISETIIRQIDNLKNIASEFSSFARMPNLKIQQCELIGLLNQTIDIFNDEKTDLKLIASHQNVIVKIDSEQFQRMIINLIRNSIQASAQKIHIYLEVLSSVIIIRICDDGNGIPENIKDKIFDLNFTTKTEGMGLGLFMSKRFVESIHGTISLVKQKDYKTSIEIKIPAANE